MAVKCRHFICDEVYQYGADSFHLVILIELVHLGCRVYFYFIICNESKIRNFLLVI
jgi:hypothetical protein